MLVLGWLACQPFLVADPGLPGTGKSVTPLPSTPLGGEPQVPAGDTAIEGVDPPTAPPDPDDTATTEPTAADTLLNPSVLVPIGEVQNE